MARAWSAYLPQWRHSIHDSPSRTNFVQLCSPSQQRTRFCFGAALLSKGQTPGMSRGAMAGV